MIRDLGVGFAELEMGMKAQAEFLHQHRAKTAQAFRGLIENMERIAQAKDAELAQAIADAEAMIGAPEQLKAAE